MRPLSERMKDWRYWVDQTLHLLIGGAIAYAFAFDSPWAIGCPVSIGAGLLRELLQNLRKDGWHGSKADAAVDVAFWTLGAIIGSLIA